MSTQNPAKRLGFNPQGKAYPGVDQKTGTRMAITFQALIDEFGVTEGVAKYHAIATLEMERLNPDTMLPERVHVFFNPAAERNWRPDLAIASLSTEIRAQVDKILSEAQSPEEQAKTAELVSVNSDQQRPVTGEEVREMNREELVKTASRFGITFDEEAPADQIAAAILSSEAFRNQTR